MLSRQDQFTAEYLLRDPAVFSCGAALLVEESVEIYRLYAAAAPVFVPE